MRSYDICYAAWLTVYGIGEKQFQRVFKCYANGMVSINEKQTRCRTHKSEVAKAWMKSSFSRMGDKMPNSAAIHLPSYLDRKALYEMMKNDLVNQRQAIISYSQFCSLMNSEFPHVGIPKVHFNRLACEQENTEFVSCVFSASLAMYTVHVVSIKLSPCFLLGMHCNFGMYFYLTCPPKCHLLSYTVDSPTLNLFDNPGNMNLHCG